jgi:ADP-ribose pyrophosphatase YjhB (NUDIX family)
MYIKIYFDDRPLFLCDDVDASLQPYIHHDDAVFIDELNTPAINSMIHEMQQPKVHAGVYFNSNLQELKKAFFKKFTIVNAAGGFVLNEKNEVLMMFRRGKWDLPKGKLDKGERLRQCAVREVEEECNVSGLKITAPLTVTYHTYRHKGRIVLKETRWYRLSCSRWKNAKPQTEEDILEVKWMTRAQVRKAMKNSYASVRFLVEASVPGIRSGRKQE